MDAENVMYLVVQFGNLLLNVAFEACLPVVLDGRIFGCAIRGGSCFFIHTPSDGSSISASASAEVPLEAESRVTVPCR